MPFSVGDWTVHEESHELVCDDRRVRLEPRAMAVLVRLALRPGEVVSQAELIDGIWKGQAVSDHSVAVVISDLRKVLGDDRREPRYIETIPKRGYRLVAPVRAPDEARTSRASAVAVAIGAAVLVALVFASIRLGADRLTASGTLVADVVNATGRDELSYMAHAASEMLTVELSRRLGSSGDVVRWREDVSRTAPSTGTFVTGRLFLVGDDVRLGLRLVDSEDGAVLWGETYPAEPASLAAASRAAAVGIAATLGVDSTESPELVAAAPEAHELYWRGRYLWSLRDRESILRALDVLERLTAAHPDFAPGHAALADVYAHKTAEELGLERVDTFAEATRHLDRARTLAPDLVEIDVTEAILAFYRDRDAGEARTRVRRALEANPRNALAWQTLAMIESATGRHDESRLAIEEAHLLDPLSASVLWDEVWFLYVEGRPEAALEAAEVASRVSAPIHLYYALLYGELNDPERALSSWLTRAELRGLGDATLEKVQNLVAARAWRDAWSELARAAESGPNYRETGLPLAVLKLRAGDREGALELLGSVDASRHEWWWVWLGEIPALAELRSEARFRDLVERLGYRD